MKHLLALVLSLSLAAGLGCDKSGDSAKVEEPGSDDSKADDKAADDKAAAAKSTDDKPADDKGDKPADDKTAAGGAFPSWKSYENKEYGFRVRAPTSSPKALNQDQPGLKLTNRAFQFMLGGDGLGQLMYISIGGKVEMDIVKALDGACTEAVKAMNGKMLEYDKVKNNGREARNFEFEATAEGITFKGFGVGIATGPRTVKAAMAFYRPAGEKMAKEFMATFEAD